MAKDKGARLGRGLAALLGDVASSQSAPEHSVRMLPLDLLRPGAFQPRVAMPEEGLRSLAASIQTNGILQPILVRPDAGSFERYEIIAGERRWRAAQIAGLHEAPCLVRPLTDSEALAAGLVENLQRLDLNAIEEAEGYRRLSDEFNLQQEELAGIVGKSRSHVANMMRLLGLPSEVAAEVRAGNLSAGHARALLGCAYPMEAARQVIRRGLNVRQTEALAKATDERAGGRPREVNADVAALERDLSGRLGLKVTISHGTKGGQLRIGYDQLDQLDGVIALLNRG